MIRGNWSDRSSDSDVENWSDRSNESDAES